MALERFIQAQEHTYAHALNEIKNGKKQGHWMWFIFPQLKGLGSSNTANYYGLENLEEAKNYLHDPVLGKRLIEISQALLQIKSKTASQIFGYPDDLKLHSSMTLFAATGLHPIFGRLLDMYFDGQPERLTLSLLKR